MDFGGLVYARLAKDGELSEKLAKFGGAPAVFDTEFPSDQQAGWEKGTQYPRICYRTDMQVNRERSSSGTLRVALYADRQSLIIDEIERLVKKRLRDVLMQPDGQSPFCMSWARTEPYLLEAPAVLCRDMVFDILEFPEQKTCELDPVAAMSTLYHPS